MCLTPAPARTAARFKPESINVRSMRILRWAGECTLVATYALEG